MAQQKPYIWKKHCAKHVGDDQMITCGEIFYTL
jgi:hypothetical protein